jgi:hypothetical protein
MSSDPDAAQPLSRPGALTPPPTAIEAARKRAALLADVVFRLARYRIALSALADFERRRGNVDGAGEIEHIYLLLDDIKRRFGIESDDAHARWRNLRQEDEPRPWRSSGRGIVDLDR